MFARRSIYDHDQWWLWQGNFCSQQYDPFILTRPISLGCEADAPVFPVGSVMYRSAGFEKVKMLDVNAPNQHPQLEQKADQEWDVTHYLTRWQNPCYSIGFLVIACSSQIEDLLYPQDVPVDAPDCFSSETDVASLMMVALRAQPLGADEWTVPDPAGQMGMAELQRFARSVTPRRLSEFGSSRRGAPLFGDDPSNDPTTGDGGPPPPDLADVPIIIENVIGFGNFCDLSLDASERADDNDPVVPTFYPGAMRFKQARQNRFKYGEVNSLCFIANNGQTETDLCIEQYGDIDWFERTRMRFRMNEAAESAFEVKFGTPWPRYCHMTDIEAMEGSWPLVPEFFFQKYTFGNVCLAGLRHDIWGPQLGGAPGTPNVAFWWYVWEVSHVLPVFNGRPVIGTWRIMFNLWPLQFDKGIFDRHEGGNFIVQFFHADPDPDHYIHAAGGFPNLTRDRGAFSMTFLCLTELLPYAFGGPTNMGPNEAIKNDGPSYFHNIVIDQSQLYVPPTYEGVTGEEQCLKGYTQFATQGGVPDVTPLFSDPSEIFPITIEVEGF